MNKLKTNLMLLLTALIWGFAFVAQQMGMDYIEPFTFNCIRFLIGFIVLQPCIYLLDKKRTASGAVSAAPVTSEDKKTLYLGAL